MPTALDLLSAGTQLPITGVYTTAEHLSTFESFVYARPGGDVVITEETVEVILAVTTVELEIEVVSVEVVVENAGEDIVVDVPLTYEFVIDPLC
jgi:hypothetical protein